MVTKLTLYTLEQLKDIAWGQKIPHKMWSYVREPKYIIVDELKKVVEQLKQEINQISLPLSSTEFKIIQGKIDKNFKSVIK